MDLDILKQRARHLITSNLFDTLQTIIINIQATRHKHLFINGFKKYASILIKISNFIHAMSEKEFEKIFFCTQLKSGSSAKSYISLQYHSLFAGLNQHAEVLYVQH